MTKKTCAVCKKEILKGTGIICYSKLVHREGCKGMMKTYPWRYV